MVFIKIKYNQGVGLIEVLIALVILAVGLLGVAQLQVASVKLNHNASLFSQATSLAYDAFDRMRASPTTADVAVSPSVRWPSALTTNSTWYNDVGLSNNPNCVDSTTSCSTTQMANSDLYDWAKKVAERLPNGSAQITKATVGTTNRYTVIVRWQERRTGTLVPTATEQLSIEGEL